MGFKNIRGEFNRTGLIADFISGKYVGNSAKKVLVRLDFLQQEERLLLVVVRPFIPLRVLVLLRFLVVELLNML